MKVTPTGWSVGLGGLGALVGCIHPGAYAPAVHAISAPHAPDEDGDRIALEHGRSLYVRRCTRCHGLYALEPLHRSGFRSTLEGMRDKAELNDKDIDAILHYLEKAPGALQAGRVD